MVNLGSSVKLLLQGCVYDHMPTLLPAECGVDTGITSSCSSALIKIVLNKYTLIRYNRNEAEHSALYCLLKSFSQLSGRAIQNPSLKHNFINWRKHFI